jgi:hypothetical protein
LEIQIITTPVFTRQGLDGKLQVVDRAALDDHDGIIATPVTLKWMLIGRMLKS